MICCDLTAIHLQQSACYADLMFDRGCHGELDEGILRLVTVKLTGIWRMSA